MLEHPGVPFREFFARFPRRLSRASPFSTRALRAITNRAPHAHPKSLRERVDDYGYHAHAMQHREKGRQ